MKKVYLLGSFFLGLFMVSCLGDSTEERTQSITGEAINIITSLEDNEVEVVARCNYGYHLKMDKNGQTGTVTSADIVAGNQSLTFSSAEQPYKSTGRDAYFENVKAIAGNTTMELNDANFLALFLYDATMNPYGYYYTLANAADYTFKLSDLSNYVTVARYYIGDSYKINTIPQTVFFRGTTTSYYPGGEEGMLSAENEDIIYRLIFDIEKKTAVMVIYNAKFSGVPAEPVKAAIILEGLAVNFTPDSIEITGENVIPGIVEDGATTPNERYVFNSLSCTISGDYLTNANLEFQCAGVYRGVFSGSYMTSPFIK